MNLLSFPGLCCYMVQGPDESISADISFWANYLASGGDTGSTATGGANYRADEVAKASLRGMPVKVGPRVTPYDPELMAMIGMEL